MPRCNQKGFTLLELIVVVAIIGIIAAIAIPQYNDYRRKSELASVMSNCRSLFRAFTLYYIENESEYPSNENEFGNPDWDFNPVTFDPLMDPDNLGGIPFEIEINQLKKNIGDSPANRARRDYFSDPSYQQFYLVMTWEKDPSVLIVVASSDNVKDLNGNLIDGGNYLDGVYIWQNGKLRYQ